MFTNLGQVDTYEALLNVSGNTLCLSQNNVINSPSLFSGRIKEGFKEKKEKKGLSKKLSFPIYNNEEELAFYFEVHECNSKYYLKVRSPNGFFVSKKDISITLKNNEIKSKIRGLLFSIFND